MNYQEAADIRALIGFAQLLARKQLEHYIASNRESEKISDGDEVCANCRKFYQHYVINGVGRVVPIRYGHCFPCGRGSKNVAWKDSCKHFEPVEEKEAAV